MKSIKLNKIRSKKLVEMCETLFPNYTFKDWNLDGKTKGIEIGFLKLWKNTENSKVEFIHWFEFCITHLITKLYNTSHLKDESSIKQLRGYVCQEVDNPIDYLYEEFKKLNK